MQSAAEIEERFWKEITTQETPMQNSVEELEARMMREFWLKDLAQQKAATRAALMARMPGMTTPSAIFDPNGPTIQQEEARLAAIESTGLSATQYIKGAQRNGPCPCGSGKRFKKCCRKVTVK